MNDQTHTVSEIIKRGVITHVVFDAMGVLYTYGDDIEKILVPYMLDHGVPVDLPAISAVYDQAKVGEITSAEFWRMIGMPGTSDEDYCSHYLLNEGSNDTIVAIKDQGFKVAVLSNDLHEWSPILRHQFGLDEIVDTWVVSGDIGVGKPDQRAFTTLLDRVGTSASHIMFIDDNPENLKAAAALGIVPVHFDTVYSDVVTNDTGTWAVVRSMADLRHQIENA